MASDYQTLLNNLNPVAQTTAPLATTAGQQIFTAPDGKIFTDIGAYNAYLAQSRQENFSRGLASARAQAEAQARNAINSRGLNYDQYSPQIQAEIDRIISGIPNLDSNPAGYFNPNMANDLLNGLQQGQRNQYGQAVSNTFTPNYAQSRISDTALDSTINDILNENNTQVTDALDRGLKRGQLNQRGAAAGTSALSKARTGVSAKLNQTENDILTGYRSKIDNIGNTAASAASGFNLGGRFDLNDYVSRADNVANDFNTNASGQFINAIGQQPLFDLSQILGASGQAQGAQNLNNLDVMEALDRRKATQGASRGLGSQGAF